MLGAVAVALSSCALLCASAAASSSRVHGVVESGSRQLDSVRVKAYRSGGAGGQTKLLGVTTTDGRGRFSMRVREPSSADAVVYLTAGSHSGIRLAATLGAAPVPSSVVVNELTTTATGYAFAQFIGGRRIAGPSPGPRNAALMAANLANVRTGKVAKVLRTSPNGGLTTTLATFKTVADMLPRCARSLTRCGRLFHLTATPDGRRARGTLQAVANIARYPWQNVRRLYRLGTSAPTPYGGTLGSSDMPSSWIMPVRFDGDGQSLDGPGNTVFDAKGNAYVANNYAYSRDLTVPACGSDQLPKFKPDGSYAKNSPFTGGGLSGAGYGITLDPNGDVWVGNYGFAAPNCPNQPPHTTVSQFSPHGEARAANGWSAGDLSWPQGTVSDSNGTIWIANCGNGIVTRMPGDDPNSAVGIDAGLQEAFDVAINDQGEAFVTGLGNSKLAILDNGGAQTALLGKAALGLDRPMGIASDSRGNMWIANSGLVDLPCPGPVSIDFATRGGSVSLLGKDGQPVTKGQGFTGGGMTVPWGIAVDGDDNVWVSNFAHQRISELCGVRRRRCRPGSQVGDPISPNGRGYFFSGFVRLTSVEIDPSGNVWSTNNWKLVPIQNNPGGYEMVVLVGAAAPLKTPLIGPPVPLMR